MYKTLKISIFIILIFPVLIFGQGNEWVRFPIYGGAVQDGLVSKSDPQRLIIKTSIETYKTADGGATWTMFSGYGMPTQNIRGMYIHPLYPDSVFMAGAYSFSVSGDFCETFTSRSLPAELRSPRGFAISYRNTRIAYIGDNYFSGDNGNGTVYKTTDGGNTWNVILDRSPSRTLDVALSEEHPDTVFAVYKDSLMRTYNGGMDWTNITNNYYTSGGAVPQNIFISPYDDNLIIIANSNQSGELSISYDGGDSWVTRDLSGSQAGGADISFDPDNQTIYMSVQGRGIFESTDRGVSWIKQTTPGLATDEIGSYLVDPQNSDTRYLLTNGPGVYKTVDDGVTWLPFNVNITEVYNTAVTESPLSTQYIIAASQYAGIQRSINGGTTWLPANSGLQDFKIYRLEWPDVGDGKSETIFAMSQISGVYLSTNNGLTWSQFNAGASLNSYSDMIFDRQNKRIICSGSGSTSYIIYSTFESGSWQDWQYFSKPPIRPQIVRYDPNTDAMYVGGNTSIYKYDGLNWLNIGGAILSDKNIYSIDIHPNADSIYAYANNKWIYLKVPGGSAWNEAYNVSDGSIATEIKFDPVQPHIQYLAHGNGKKSVDGGKNWDEFPRSFWSSMGVNISVHDRNRIYSRTRNGLLYFQQTPEVSTAVMVDAGQVSIGSNNIISVEIQNNGWGQLKVSDFMLVGAHSSHWSLLDNNDVNLNYQEKDTIRVRFEPDSVLDLSVQLSCISNDPSNPAVSITLNGVGGGALLSIEPALDFGNVYLQSPKFLPVQISNTGNSPLQMSGTLINGANPDMFVITAGGGAKTVQPDSSHNIIVQFTPVSSNLFTANLQIQSGDAYNPVHNVSLSGTGTIIPAGNISLSTNTINFGEVTQGETSDTLQLVLTNTDNDFEIQVDSIIVADTTHFTILNPTETPFVIDTVSQKAFDLTFSPQDFKTYNTNIKIYSNAANGALQTVALSGKGVEPPGDIAISLGTLVFGSVVVDSVSMTHELTISNESSFYPLITDSLICTPEEFTYTVSEELPYELAPQSDLKLGLTFQPADSGIFNGSLSIYSNDKENPLLIINLSGTGYYSSGPQVIINPTVITASSGSSKSISLNIDSDLTIEYARLIYAMGGASNLDSIALSSSDGSQYSGTIPSNHITSKGVTYFFRVSDGQHIVRYPETGSLNLPVTITNLDHSIPGDGSYKMVSIPMQLQDSSPLSVLGDNLGEYDVYNWRLFRWLGGENTEFNNQTKNIGNFQPGKAFWLAAKSASSFNTGQGTSTPVADNFTVSLDQGWNQIGNPYIFNVAWSDVLVNGQVSGELWHYNTGSREYELKSSMVPWEGYFVRALASGASLDFQPLTSGLLKPGLEIPQAADWTVQIVAVSDASRDRYNYVGMSESAADEYDSFDFGEPPVIDKYISVSLPHDDWIYPGKYSSDIRYLSDAGAVWVVRAESNIDQAKVLLSFEEQGEFPANFEIWLVDKALRMPVSLNETRAYSFQFRRTEEYREFELIIGNSAFIEEKVASIAEIPGELTLYPNFPNPFNPETHIKFYLPSEQDVQLEIFNILGQNVVTLVPRQRMNKGFHSEMWDGKDPRGENVASGMYIYILRSGSDVRTKKLILLR